MEVEIVQGVCNNSPAECTSPENGRCLSRSPMVRRLSGSLSQSRVGGRGARAEAFGVSLRAIVYLVQILVVVAIILLRTRKTEAE